VGVEQRRGSTRHARFSAGERGTEEGWAVRGPRLGTGDRGIGVILQTVLEQQVGVVPLVEDLALDVRIELLQPANLAVLLRDQLLIEGRYLDVNVELGKVEVGRETVRDRARPVPIDVERRRLVEPVDLIEVEQPSELPLAVVRELDLRVGKASGCVATLGACGYV
jgi:hypothetical protein